VLEDTARQIRRHCACCVHASDARNRLREACVEPRVKDRLLEPARPRLASSEARFLFREPVPNVGAAVSDFPRNRLPELSM